MTIKVVKMCRLTTCPEGPWACLERTTKPVDIAWLHKCCKLNHHQVILCNNIQREGDNYNERVTKMKEKFQPQIFQKQITFYHKKSYGIPLRRCWITY